MKGIQEAIRILELYGFQACTEAASQPDSTAYLCAFERPGEQEGIRYCYATEDDLLALVLLVEASASLA